MMRKGRGKNERGEEGGSKRRRKLNENGKCTNIDIRAVERRRRWKSRGDKNRRVNVI